MAGGGSFRSTSPANGPAEKGDAMSVQPSIEVALDERGPTVIRIAQRDRAGHELALEREDPYLLEAEERAFRELLSAGMRLPCGSIEVLVAEDPVDGFPSSAQVGGAIARRALTA